MAASRKLSVVNCYMSLQASSALRPQCSLWGLIFPSDGKASAGQADVGRSKGGQQTYVVVSRL